MKRLALLAAIFLVTASTAHLITRRFVADSPPASFSSVSPGPPTRLSAQSSPSAPDDPMVDQMKREFAGHQGPQQEAERLAIVARAAHLKSLTQSGDLTPAMIDLLGLTDAQAQKIQECMDDARDRMSQDLKGRLNFSAATSREMEEKEAGLRKGDPSLERSLTAMKHFTISASPDTGAIIKEELRQNLSAVAGDLATEVLLDERLLPEMFGKFGEYPIQGTITDYSSEGRSVQMFEFQVRNLNGDVYFGYTGGGRRSSQLYLGSTLDDYLSDEDDW